MSDRVCGGLSTGLRRVDSERWSQIQNTRANNLHCAWEVGWSDQNLKKNQNNNKKLTHSVRPCNFSIAQLFQRDDMSHTATGWRQWKTINASSLPLSLKPAWPPTTQRRLISEAYNCGRHAVNLPVFASFLIETESLRFFSPTTTPPFSRAAHFLSVGDLSNHVGSYACYEREWKGGMSEHTLL